MQSEQSFFGDEIERITEIDLLTGEIKSELSHVAIFSGITLRCIEGEH